ALAEPAGLARARAVARDHPVAMPRAEAVPRKPSSAPHRELKRHRRPFCRQKSSAAMTMCSRLRLLSSRDASLSQPETCPGHDRGSEPGAPREGGAPEASPGTLRLRDAGTHGDATACTLRTAAVPDHNEHRSEAEFDIARTRRAGTLTTTRNSMPAFSGHGARTVMTSRSPDEGELLKA